MTIQKGFKKRSRKKSSAGRAFGQKNNGVASADGGGKFGDMNFLKRLLGRTGIDFKNNSGQTELLLMAQLGDMDAIQLLIDSGIDAKDALGLSSLHAKALSGDMDAERLLGNRGFSIRRQATAEEIDAYTMIAYAPVPSTEETSPLKRALAAASQRIENMSRALQQEAPAQKPASFVLKTSG